MNDEVPSGILRRYYTELLEIATDDGRTIEAMLFEPSAPAIANLILIHGKGGNFYSGICRFLPPLLSLNGIRTLTLNMRCHDLGYTRADVPFIDIENGHAHVDGGMWEDLDKGTLDIQAGYRIFQNFPKVANFIGGHSSGGFYSALFNPDDDSLRGRILLSPLVSNKRPLIHWFGNETRLEQALIEASQLIEQGNGKQLIRTGTWYFAISAESLVQRYQEPEGLFAESLENSKTPIFLAWGSMEGRGPSWNELADKLTIPVFKTIYEGSDHNYIGAEDMVSNSVLTFLNTLTQVPYIGYPIEKKGWR